MAGILEEYEQYLNLTIDEATPAPPADMASPPIEDNAPLPTLAILYAGLMWSEAERIQNELAAQGANTRPMYGIGMNAAGYFIRHWDYRRGRSAQ